MYLDSFINLKLILSIGTLFFCTIIFHYVVDAIFNYFFSWTRYQSLVPFIIIQIAHDFDWLFDNVTNIVSNTFYILMDHYFSKLARHLRQCPFVLYFRFCNRLFMNLQLYVHLGLVTRNECAFVNHRLYVLVSELLLKLYKIKHSISKCTFSIEVNMLIDWSELYVNQFRWLDWFCSIISYCNAIYESLFHCNCNGSDDVNHNCILHLPFVKLL